MTSEIIYQGDLRTQATHLQSGDIANRHEINILGTQVSIHKIMQANPRRIAAIEVTMYMPNVTYTPKERALLENAARTCPVALSLHPELEQKLSFVYQ